MNETKTTVPKLMVHELIHEFEEFVGVLKEIHTFSGDSLDKRQTFLRHVGSAQNRLKAHFTRAARSMGMSFEQFCEFIGDSENFEPKDWEAMQTAKESLAKGFSGKTSGKKANKNLKI